MTGIRCLRSLTGILVVLSVWNALPAEAQSSGVAVDQSCQREATTRSQGATGETEYTITNRTAERLVVYWLDYQGRRQKWFELQPGATHVQRTYRTHPWLVADSRGQCSQIFSAPGKIVVAAPSSVVSGKQAPAESGVRPIVLMIDGADHLATGENPVVKTGYLANAMWLSSEALRQLNPEIKPYAWSGDVLQTSEAVQDLKRNILQSLQVARNDRRPIAIVGHSWGGVLSYLALRELDEAGQLNDGDVALFLTIHTPINMKALHTQVLPSTRSLSMLIFGLVRSHIRTPLLPVRAGSWKNYWSAEDWLSGPVSVAIDVENKGVGHTQSYTDAALVARYAADLLAIGAPLVATAPGRPQESARPSGTGSEVTTSSTGGASETSSTLAKLAGRWQGVTSAGSKFVWNIGEDGRYESVYRRPFQEVRETGKVSVASGGSLHWRSDTGQKGTLSLRESSGARVLRGNIQGSKITFEMTQVAEAVASTKAEPSRESGGESARPGDGAASQGPQAGSGKAQGADRRDNSDSRVKWSIKFGLALPNTPPCREVFQVQGEVSDESVLESEEATKGLLRDGWEFFARQCPAEASRIGLLGVTVVIFSPKNQQQGPAVSALFQQQGRSLGAYQNRVQRAAEERKAKQAAAQEQAKQAQDRQKQEEEQRKLAAEAARRAAATLKEGVVCQIPTPQQRPAGKSIPEEIRQAVFERTRMFAQPDAMPVLPHGAMKFPGVVDQSWESDERVRFSRALAKNGLAHVTVRRESLFEVEIVTMYPAGLKPCFRGSGELIVSGYEVKTIDHYERYSAKVRKRNQELQTEIHAVTFTFRALPAFTGALEIIPGMPTQYQGKALVYRDPSEGRWKVFELMGRQSDREQWKLIEREANE